MPPATADYRPQIPPANSGSRAFQMHTDRGLCWCKQLTNPQGAMVLVNEQICAAFSKVVEIPVCDAWIVEIPDALTPDEMAPGYCLEAGFAHGSVQVPRAVQVRPTMGHRTDDDNAKRHVGLFGLYDWLWGSDDQWLLSAPQHNAYYAHDQGFFFPGGPNWTAAQLMADRDTPHPLNQPADDLDRGEISRLAAALEGLTEQDLRECLPNFPASWPIDATALSAVIDFAIHRAPAVAQRLRSL